MSFEQSILQVGGSVLPERLIVSCSTLRHLSVKLSAFARVTTR